MGTFENYLISEEKAKGTVEKYVRDVKQFLDWLDDGELAKETVMLWKDELLQRGLKPTTINGKLASLNGYLKWLGRSECCVTSLRLQRSVFREQRRELRKHEYEKLLAEAEKQGKERLKLIMETICSTGIRVSELRYITVEAAVSGRTSVILKGKIRTILLPPKLCQKLRLYAKRKRIASGEIFRTRTGAVLSRKQIWAEMKDLCTKAGVEATKVFPHNLRHLFARCFYRISKDLVQLADVLGHSSIETTRIYLISTGEEHARTMEQLKLIS